MNMLHAVVSNYLEASNTFSLSWNEYGVVKELSTPSNAATQRGILAKSALLFAVR